MVISSNLLIFLNVFQMLYNGYRNIKVRVTSKFICTCTNQKCTPTNFKSVGGFIWARGHIMLPHPLGTYYHPEGYHVYWSEFKMFDATKSELLCWDNPEGVWLLSQTRRSTWMWFMTYSQHLYQLPTLCLIYLSIISFSYYSFITHHEKAGLSHI